MKRAEDLELVAVAVAVAVAVPMAADTEFEYRSLALIYWLDVDTLGPIYHCVNGII